LRAICGFVSEKSNRLLIFMLNMFHVKRHLVQANRTRIEALNCK
jgi:hypothetical protein